MSELKYLP